jgi:RNA polymerase sigma-70 factor, ECF subfamily
LTDKEIVQAVLAGDVEAYSQLIQAHQARVRLICLGFLASASDADDAAQDAFMKAYESLSSFKGDAAFGTWISRIASNHCLDLLRARKRHHTDSLDALMDQKGDSLQRLVENPPEEYSRDDFELLGKVFGTLPEEERKVLILREAEELSYEQIASKLQCSLDAVKGRLKRARQHLMEKAGRFLTLP